MSDDDAVLQATYHNIRAVHGRGVVQIVFETDLAHWDHVNSVLGPPNSSEGRWFAIARIFGPDATI